MNDERLYLANIIFLSGSSWIRKFQDAGIMDRKLLCRHSTTTVIPNEIDPISRWLLRRVFLYYVENLFCVQRRLGMA